MRNRGLSIGASWIALSILPACTLEPADEASEISKIDLIEELAGNADVRQGAVVDDGPIPIFDCGLTPYNDRHCYHIRNCGDGVIRRRIVTYSGSTATCFAIPAGSGLSDCLASGRVSHMKDC